MEYLVRDIEEFASRLKEVNSKKAEGNESGLHRIRGSVDLTFEDPEKKDSGILKMVGCYSYVKKSLFGKKVRYFDVTMKFERTKSGVYRLNVSDLQTYRMDKGTIRLVDEKAPEELFNLIDEDLLEAGAKRA
ncbi:MAG: hypothetical protein J7L11_03070 [Thermoprotei archaeon]|nr:hypothetical protein [Thermoprotei archaeon]